MEMPLIDRCFGFIPPKHGSWLIALFGLAVGGLGITSIVIFSLVEDYLVAHLTKSNEKPDGSFKKLVLLFIGITSLLLLTANTLLALGVVTSNLSMVQGAKFVIFAMCIIMILFLIGMPLSCFYKEGLCIIKTFSVPGIVIGYIFIGTFVTLWLYFMIVVYNFQLEL